MNFGLTEEQKMIVEATRAFVENELYPHEAEVERTGVLREDLRKEIAAKAIAAGLYAANMPEDVAALEHPSGLRGRSARAVSLPLYPRRKA